MFLCLKIYLLSIFCELAPLIDSIVFDLFIKITRNGKKNLTVNADFSCVSWMIFTNQLFRLDLRCYCEAGQLLNFWDKSNNHTLKFG